MMPDFFFGGGGGGGGPSEEKKNPKSRIRFIEVMIATFDFFFKYLLIN